MDKEDKIILAIVVTILIIILGTPIKMIYKDGGSVSYKAILWSYTDWCAMAESGRYDKPDAEFRILLFNYVID